MLTGGDFPLLQEERPMKGALAAITAFAAITAAAAKPTAVEPSRSANPTAHASVNMESNIVPARATLERNYFREPNTDFHPGLFLCRLEPNMFAKARLTQSCK
jgi:hypothetical protein